MDHHDAQISKLIDGVILMYATIANSLEALVAVDELLPGPTTPMHQYAIERGPALLDQLEKDLCQAQLDGTLAQRGQFYHVAERIGKALRSICGQAKKARTLDSSMN